MKTTYKQLDDFSPYRKACSRLAELESEHATAVEHVAAWRQKIGGAVDVLTQKASELVAGGGQTITLVSAQSELKEAKEQLEVLTKAVELQNVVITERLADAQVSMQNDRRPGHKICIQSISDALDKLQEACEAEKEFSNALFRDGQFTSAPFVTGELPFDIHGDRPFGQFLKWRRRFFNNGYLSPPTDS